MRRAKKAVSILLTMVMLFVCAACITHITSNSYAFETVYAAEDNGQQTTQTQPTTAKQTKEGWSKDKKYYYRNGKPLKGIKKVGKTWYEFNKKTGKLKRKIGDGMDKKAQKYKSGKKYLVLVDKDRHQVRIYKGKKKKWKRVKKFKCTVGARGTRTPSGTFKVTSKGRYFNTGSNMRCWYWTGFIGSQYLFHSVLYNRNSSPSHIVDGRLGRDLSHGCIRMKLSAAKWMYSKVPRGSKVVIKNRF